MRLKTALLCLLVMATCGACQAKNTLVQFYTPRAFRNAVLSHARWDQAAGGFVFDAKTKAQPGVDDKTAVVESPEIPGDTPFDHAVTSWNAFTPKGSYINVYMQARIGGKWTRWYKMGLWNTDGAPRQRKCFNDKDDDGGMDCEVLILKHKADALKAKFELLSSDGKTYPTLRYVAVEMNDSAVVSEEIKPVKSAWGKELDVPYLSQQSVPGGAGWCSATSVTMVLRYWGSKLNRTDMSSLGITEAAHGIHDAGLGGTGDWSFNTAYAGEYKGMRAYVARLMSTSEIEKWISYGVPVIISVDYSKLIHRKGARAGHLMVVRGFTADGQVVVNDPDEPLTRVDKMRKVFSRADLESGWLGQAGSWGTVYIIYPENYKL